MRGRTSLWTKLASGGRFNMDARAVIDGKEYARITAPQISRSLATQPLSVGNCNAASLKLSVLLDDGESIPDAAAVRIIARITDLDITTSAETMPFGEYWVDTCAQSGNLYTLSCYDAMLKTSQAMVDETDDESEWPKSMAVVVQEIAYRIGVPIDPRTKINRGLDYMVPYPSGYTMQQVLGWIGGCHGGNWTITEDGMLRLVPLFASGSGSGVDSLITEKYPVVDHEWNDIVAPEGQELVYQDEGAFFSEQGIVNVAFVGGDVTTGKKLKISKITMSDDEEHEYSKGDDTGFALEISANPYACQSICNALYESLCGMEYQPFTAPDAVFDPAAELGDQVIIGDIVYSTIYSMDMTLNIGYANTISAPTNTEVTRQYPYLTKRDKDRDKQYLEADSTYAGVSLSETEGIVVAKTINMAEQTAAISLETEGRQVRSGVSRAEVQYSDRYIVMRARDAETGKMLPCIFFDDETESYHISKDVLIDQADELEEELTTLSEKLNAIAGDGGGSETVSLPLLLQKIEAVQTSLSEQKQVLDSLDEDSADILSKLKDVQDTLSKLDSAVSNIRVVVDGNASSLASIKSILSAQSEAINSNKAALADVKADTTAIKETQTEHTAKLDELKEDVSGIRTVVDAHTDALTEIQATLASQGNVLDEMMALIKAMVKDDTAEPTPDPEPEPEPDPDPDADEGTT